VRFDLRTVLGATLLIAAALRPSPARADSGAANLLAEGRVDDAIVLLQGRISNSRQDAESYSLLCRAYLMLGEWDPGVAACEKAVSLDPANGEYHSWLGRVYGEKAEHSSFIAAARMAAKVCDQFEAAVRLNPKSVDARADLADFYLEAPRILGGGRGKAEVQAQEMDALDPAQAHRIKARIAEEKKDPDTAEKEYRLAIRLSGGQAGTWLNLARFYRRAGRLDDMEAALQMAVAPQMNRPDLLMGAAEMLISTGRNLPQAKQLLRRYVSSGATVEDAPLFKAYYLLGTILEREGDERSAAEQYRAALALARNFSLAQKALVRLRSQNKTAPPAD
jgi:tetratricopeptide (TPR) repeat protein